MNCAALKRIGARYHFLFGSEKEEKVLKTLSIYLKVYHVVKRLKHTFLGLIGYRPTGFYSSTFDETLIRKTFGISIEEQDLVALTTIAEKIDSTLIKKDIKQLSASIDHIDLPEGHLENHSRIWHGLNKLVDQFGFNALTLKCWPEMGEMKMTPCAAISRFANEKFIIGCESDVNTTISMLVEQFFTNDIVFMSDLIKVDPKKNSALFWHCGQAAGKLHGDVCGRELRNHSLAGEGVVVEGTLKTGKVTICLFNNIEGKYRLFLTTGEALPTEKVVRGVMTEIKLNVPVINTIYKIAEEGIPHHYAIVWQDIAHELRAIAEYLGIEIIE
jgi:L-fucose isomerase-like protein